MPSITLKVKPKDPRHRKILKALEARFKYSKSKMTSQHSKWRKAEEAAVAYLPEREHDSARKAKRDGGKPEYTTLCIPYSYSILMTAHTYWTSVFLGRNPVYQFAARHGETQQQVQAIEAISEYQLYNGKHLVPYYIWLMDVGKYGIGIVGDYWEDEEIHLSKIEEIEEVIQFGPMSFKTGKMKKQQTTMKMKGYQGTKVYNVRPYDWFPDPRVPLNRFQEGEFVGRLVSPGWNTILKREAQGYYMNIDALRKKKTAKTQDTWGSSAFEEVETSALLSEDELKDVDQRHLLEMTVELIPEQWGMGDGKFPEKWFFTCTDDFDLLIGASPQSAYHNEYPFSMLELEPEGYALVNRGLMEITQPLQDTMDWLFNTHFYNIRKVLNDQMIVDPSKVNMGDVLDPLPGGIWRLRPEAYGTDVRTAAHQFMIQDVTQAHLKDTEIVGSLLQRVTGVNDGVMGMVNSGGRKTATEVRGANTNSTNRLKTQTEYFSACGWTGLSQRMVMNGQQYYDEERVYKIAGDLLGSSQLKISPDMIKGFYDFIPVDGTLPIDRFAQSNLWRMILADIQKMPQIMMQYDLGKIFAYTAQLAGLKNINQFKIQIMPDQQLAMQAQAGNVVPMGGKSSGGARGSNATGSAGNVLDPGQIPGLGPTA